MLLQTKSTVSHSKSTKHGTHLKYISLKIIGLNICLSVYLLECVLLPKSVPTLPIKPAVTTVMFIIVLVTSSKE